MFIAKILISNQWHSGKRQILPIADDVPHHLIGDDVGEQTAHVWSARTGEPPVRGRGSVRGWPSAPARSEARRLATSRGVILPKNAAASLMCSKAHSSSAAFTTVIEPATAWIRSPAR